MKLTLGVVIASLLFFASVDQTLAKSYPDKKEIIRIIVPWPPGGSNDVLARVVGQGLQEAWGQRVVIDNRPGANGNIGTALVKNSAPDGYTLLTAPSAIISMYSTLYKKPPFDVFKDFEPVALLGSVSVVMAVNPSVPAKSVKEFVALAKAKPGSLAYGIAGIGSVQHMTAELFMARAGIKMVQVPYKGGVPMVMDLLAGQTQVVFGASNSLLPHFKSGGLRALGIAGEKRDPTLPDVPTIEEGGVHGVNATSWTCLLAPKGISSDIVNKVNREINKTLKDPDVLKKLRVQGIEPLIGTPAEFATRLRNEIDFWGEVIKSAGISQL